MELDHVWDLSIAEPLQTLASLSVPKLHLTVITTREELSTIVGEAQILDSFDMSMECSQAATVSIYVPELMHSRLDTSKRTEFIWACLDFGIHASAEQQMVGARKEADDRHSLCVSCPGVYADFWYEAILRPSLL